MYKFFNLKILIYKAANDYYFLTFDLSTINFKISFHPLGALIEINQSKTLTFTITITSQIRC